MNNEQIACIILSVLIVALIIVIVNLWIELKERKKKNINCENLLISAQNKIIEEQIEKMELFDKKVKTERDLREKISNLELNNELLTMDINGLRKTNQIKPKHKLDDKLTFYDKNGNLISGKIDRIKKSHIEATKRYKGVIYFYDLSLQYPFSYEIEYLVNGETILESELDEATQKKYLEERLHKIEQGLIQTNKKVIKKEGK